MEWPTLGSRKAKEQNITVQNNHMRKSKNMQEWGTRPGACVAEGYQEGRWTGSILEKK